MLEETNEGWETAASIALELTKMIATADTAGAEARAKDARGYYLKLFNDCYDTVISGELPANEADPAP